MGHHISFRSAILPFSVAAALSLTACGAQDAQNAQKSAETSATTSAAEAGAESGADQAGEGAVTLEGAWVKATDEDMTAIFGTLENPSDAAVTLESAEVDVDADAEMHEVVQEAGSSVMKPVDGGLEIPADGELNLEPGGYHIMLVNLGEPITPGQDLKLTLHFSDGSESVTTVPARAFEGAQEEYHADDDDEGMDHGDMNHGDMNHGDMDHGSEGNDH